MADDDPSGGRGRSDLFEAERQRADRLSGHRVDCPALECEFVLTQNGTRLRAGADSGGLLRAGRAGMRCNREDRLSGKRGKVESRPSVVRHTVRALSLGLLEPFRLRL